jgi:hypothetical protein
MFPEELRLPDGKTTQLAKPTRVSAGYEIVPTLVDPTTEYGVGVPKFSFQLDVRDPPAKVIGAMVDFSERRPEIWPNLTASLYRVHELGPRTADVTEGTALPGVDIWERVTYEWTDSVVRGVITDGRIFEPGGTFEFRVEPRGAGSRISNDYHRRSKTVLGRCLGAMLQISGGAPIKHTFRQVYGKPS